VARLYANENFPLPVVIELRQLGHDVLTTRDAGKAERAIPDEEVLAFAHEQGRMLLTLNRKHFIALHRKKPEHSGIIVCTFDTDFPAQALRIHSTIGSVDPAAGQLLRVNRPHPAESLP
jgi:hypothetical protein